MDPNEFLLDKREGGYVFDTTTANRVEVYDDNAAFFAAVLTDLRRARGPKHFFYFAGWWTDTYLPLGSPRPIATPPLAPPPRTPLLREILSALSAGLPGLPPPDMSTSRGENQLGPQIAGMVWQHKGQKDLAALPAIVLPTSIFGAPILSAINTETVKFINSLRGQNHVILDKEHRFAGSHHQKFVVILNEDGLVGYLGSSDFNPDRLFGAGDQTAHHPTTTKGAPLNDVNVRVVGPAAVDLLRTFIDRWKLHSEGRGRRLLGENYVPISRPTGGGVIAQVSHTYGKGYPFKNAVRTAADTQLKIIRAARQYLYYEDQYLIGTLELAAALSDRLRSNLDLIVVGVMASAAVADLPWVRERRSEFWLPLVMTYPGRVILAEMLSTKGSDSGPGAYLHNKATIADDIVATVGSVNFSRRSATHDSEIQIALGGSTTTENGRSPLGREIRIRRWARHLGVSRERLMEIPDGLALWKRLPLTALVRSWTPTPNTMTAEERLIYRNSYDTLVDPP
jgi:phosphatidylserine/phosphatidylglycerophosphate/cardiolipin synthase-like enzyme